MRIECEKLKQLHTTYFLHYNLYPDGGSVISVEGFINTKTSDVFELTLLDVNENERGKGLGRLVLQQLREYYSHINVYYILSQATGFWTKMFVERLVDGIHYNGSGLTPAKRKIWDHWGDVPL